MYERSKSYLFFPVFEKTRVHTVLTVWRVRVLIAALLFMQYGCVAGGLADFDLTDQSVSSHRFTAGDVSIEGSLVQPAGCNSQSTALIVHGDGPQDRWSASGYLPIVNALLDECIAVFSWDKPGIGGSTGNWLSQSMDDRAVVASAALEYVRNLDESSGKRIGYLGFSQAGWVIPIASSLSGAGSVFNGNQAATRRAQQ